jgi:hypothetical protein
MRLLTCSGLTKIVKGERLREGKFGNKMKG